MNQDNKDIINQDENPVETQYVDENGNPIDPSLIDENGNYIGNNVEYVDENGNHIDNDKVNEINSQENLQKIENHELNGDTLSQEEISETSASARQMDNKEMFTGMVTFDYNNVPITDIVNSIILDAINKGASDIHFDPFPDGIKIRLRIDGVLHDYSIVPLYVKKNMITRIKIISSMNITETRMPQDGAIRTELADKTIDLRVACLPTSMGEKIVIRIMDYSMSASGVEGLDFSPKNLEKVNKMLSLPNGIILVTGATGTGKSTTVYSMLQVLNKESTNIITVEDPIEMNIGGINQVQANDEIGLNFATVLREILREDPDVIMIGEIRDDETARIAVRASITGHLVLSTIHTNNSLNTIERLEDMSVERYLLGSSLEGIISQKLARRLCPDCKVLRKTTDYEKEVFKKALGKDVEEMYVPVGCPNCDGGYRGRIAIHEVLQINQAIRDAITRGDRKEQLRKLVYGNGYTTTMLQDGLEKVLLGETSFDEILKLIDLDDDLGSNTQLGLQNQLEDSYTEETEVLPTSTNQTNVIPQVQPMYVQYPTSINLDAESLKKALRDAGIQFVTNSNQTPVQQNTQVQPIQQQPVVTNKDSNNATKAPDVPLEDLAKNQLPDEDIKSVNIDNITKDKNITDKDVTKNEKQTKEDKKDNKNKNVKNNKDNSKTNDKKNKKNDKVIKYEEDKEDTKEEKPVITMKLDSSNTVKPIYIDDDKAYGYKTVSLLDDPETAKAFSDIDAIANEVNDKDLSVLDKDPSTDNDKVVFDDVKTDTNDKVTDSYIDNVINDDKE